MKKLMMTTAIVAATTFGAAAQTGYGAEQNGAAAGQMMVPAFLATDFTGMTLYTLDSDAARAAGQPQGDAAVDGQPRSQRWTSSDVFMAERDNWESVGSISDVVMSQDGAVRGILIDVGGFLGMFARTVMVDIDELYFVADDSTAEDLNDFFVVASLTREQLEALPEWSEEMLHAGFEYRSAQHGAATHEAGEAAGMGDQQATMDQEPVMEPGAQGDAAMGAEPGAATEDGQIGAPGAPAAIPEGYVAVDPTVPTAEQLTDADVYDAAGDHIGNVSDAILDPDAGVREVIVDVGGFLGLGSHTVALPVDGAEILWNEQDDSVRIHVAMTREQLESLPEYEG
ncbi:MAG: PRC-barrel domain-containing protein [Pararhodobacter sp.]|nr:PRC-barrel domain-containing protein [Pararhodobacter sp.]